jgi:dihydrofolate synthase/folylpolyglutamate synthase
MNFAAATQYLLSLGHETLTMKLGLRNTELLLASLGHPQKTFASVQIAGTNGKGSTAVMLDSICRAAGISPGRYTSPHLVSITERITINGKEIAEDRFADLTCEVKETADRLIARGELPALPTFFEHVTAIALLAFKHANVALAILETGLGGRLDATTAVGAGTIAITPISIDHQDYLGNSLAEIASEKAAIIHPGSVVVVAPQPEEARQIILARCRETGVTPTWISEDSFKAGAPGAYNFHTRNNSYMGVQPGLRGAHQLTNAATAIALAETLASQGFSIDDAAIIEGLQTARHPGRLEVFEGGKSDEGKIFVLLDGAHNPAGAVALKNYLNDRFPPGTSRTLVFGAMADKQVEQMAAVLFPLATRLILTEPRNPRAATVRALKQLAEKYSPHVDAELVTESSKAIERAIALAAANEEAICVTGSLYLIGEVRQWLEQRYASTGRFS